MILQDTDLQVSRKALRVVAALCQEGKKRWSELSRSILGMLAVLERTAVPDT